MAEVAGFGDELKASEARLDAIRGEIEAIALGIPNLPHESVPHGDDETGNVEQHRWGTPRAFDFAVQGPRRARRAQGLARRRHRREAVAARASPCCAAQLARLHRALAQFMLDLHTDEHGYQETNVPLLVNADSHARHRPAAEVRGRPVRDHGRRRRGGSKRYLIPTSEVPLTNIVRDEIVEDDALPLRMTAHSMCFRAEAGSHGRDTRGMIRQHQFEKVELVTHRAPGRERTTSTSA